MVVKHYRAFAFLLVLVLLAACQPLPEENPTPTPIPTPASSSKPVYEVKRGSIVDQLKMLGRVAAVQEQQLYFKVGGRVKSVDVQLNQKVSQGTILAQLETGQLETQIKQAQISLDVANLRLQQAQSKDKGVDLLQSQSQVNTAEAALETAQANLQKLQNGASDADIQAAQSNVNSAKVALQNAQAKLTQAKAAAGTAVSSNPDIKSAETAVAAQQAKVEQLQADLAKLQAGRSAEELTIAKANVEKAKANLQQKQADYDKIASRPDAGASPQAAALQQATIDYNVAQAQLDQLLKSDPAAVAAAQQNLDVAKSQLASLQAKLDQLKAQAPTQAANDVSAQESAVAAAQANLDSAQAKLQQLTRGPSSADLATANAAVATAQANLEVAKANYKQKTESASSTDFDALILAKGVESAKVQLDYLQQSMEDQTIRAPFDGIVTQIASTGGGKPGDQVQAFAVIFTMANPQNIEVAVDMNESDVAKVGLGMQATLNSDRLPGKVLTGKVRALPGDIVRPPNSRPQIRIAFDQVPNLEIGGIINVTIIAQKKDNVLLVPNSTIRSFAGRRYVQVVDSSGRKREVDVEVGIQGATDTEIVQGLKEGDKVLGQ